MRALQTGSLQTIATCSQGGGAGNRQKALAKSRRTMAAVEDCNSLPAPMLQREDAMHDRAESGRLAAPLAGRAGAATEVVSFVVPVFNVVECIDEFHRQLAAVLPTLGRPVQVGFVRREAIAAVGQRNNGQQRQNQSGDCRFGRASKP